MKTRIGVDIDGVIAIHYAKTIDLLNRLFATDVAPQELDDYWFERYWATRYPQIAQEEVSSVLAEIFADPDYLASAAPSLPMLSALKRLSGMSLDPNGVTIVTARQADLAGSTKRWLDDLGVSYHAIAHTDDKVAYCRSTAIKYLVEDAPHHAEACAQAGIGVFLIDQPYNQAVATGRNGIWRVENPLTIPELIAEDLRR